jgi:carbonic anhydrase
MREDSMVNSCSCCSTPAHRHFDRRRFLQSAGIAGLATAFPIAAPIIASAASGNYEAMLLSCIDPRMVTPVYKYMDARGLGGRYSQFVIAGAGAAVVASRFKTWRPAFWDNLAVSVELHHINRVIVIDHRDCGAVRLAYGEKSIATPEVETVTHRKILAEFREALAKRHPHLGAETGLMALDGSFQTLA